MPRTSAQTSDTVVVMQPPGPAGTPWVAAQRPPARVGGSRLRWCAAAALLGMVLMVAGAFLPWLYSGSVGKNSLHLVGVGQRLLDASGWIRAVLVGWPFLGPICAVVVVLFLLRLTRSAAVLGIAVAAVAAMISAGILIVSSRSSSTLIAPAYLGPVTTLSGAVMTLCAAVGVLLWRTPAQPDPATRSEWVGR